MKYDYILEVNGKEWFDRLNGNSYFSARITLDDKLVAVLPFQYGYGSHYLNMAMQKLKTIGAFTDAVEHGSSLWRYCDEHNIKLITNMQEKCLQREVIAHGAEL